MLKLVRRIDYTHIYCYAEDDEGVPRAMIFDDLGNFGPKNVVTIQGGIGTVQTLDESPAIFTDLSSA